MTLTPPMAAPADKLGLHFVGHVLIRDKASGTILVDAFNAINRENASYALALALADRSTGHIQSMAFGNGGSIVSAVGTILYLPPNVSGIEAALYNQTYIKVVDDQSPLNGNPVDNNILVNHVVNTFYSDVQVTCTLDYNEPTGQAAFDDAPVVNGTTPVIGGNTPDPTGNYIFDELGLVTFDPITGAGRLLSHVIFHPVQKSLNRSIEIVYVIRIVLS
jgi:hypothetical protein